MSGQIDKIQKRYSATSEHQAPETLTILSSIWWRMALPFVLEIYSSFSNHNFSCYFQQHLRVKAKLPKACKRNKHFMMAKGPKNLQENTCRERHSPTRQ